MKTMKHKKVKFSESVREWIYDQTLGEKTARQTMLDSKKLSRNRMNSSLEKAQAKSLSIEAYQEKNAIKWNLINEIRRLQVINANQQLREPSIILTFKPSIMRNISDLGPSFSQ